MRVLLMSAATLAVAGCAMNDPEPPLPGAGTDQAAEANVVRSDGVTLVRARAVETGSGVLVAVTAQGLAAGTYGVHVHTTGRCDPPGFDSAGPHWNPTGRQHGAQNPLGPHRGDLPNLIVGANGEGEFSFTIPGARLTGGAAPMLDRDGAALVVHARPDDYRTDPSGSSGARIGCGVFG